METPGLILCSALKTEVPVSPKDRGRKLQPGTLSMFEETLSLEQERKSQKARARIIVQGDGFPQYGHACGPSCASAFWPAAAYSTFDPSTTRQVHTLPQPRV